MLHCLNATSLTGHRPAGRSIRREFSAITSLNLSCSSRAVTAPHPSRSSINRSGGSTGKTCRHFVGFLATLIISGSLICAPPAWADRYPFCLPTEAPDCFFIGEVDRTVFPVSPYEVANVIAKGKEACRQMAANGGTDPVSDWAERFGDSPATYKKAHLFAPLAGASYCPSILGY